MADFVRMEGCAAAYRLKRRRCINTVLTVAEKIRDLQSDNITGLQQLKNELSTIIVPSWESCLVSPIVDAISGRLGVGTYRQYHNSRVDITVGELRFALVLADEQEGKLRLSTDNGLFDVPYDADVEWFLELICPKGQERSS